jgi:hypothetical protein
MLKCTTDAHRPPNLQCTLGPGDARLASFAGTYREPRRAKVNQREASRESRWTEAIRAAGYIAGKVRASVGRGLGAKVTGRWLGFCVCFCLLCVCVCVCVCVCKVGGGGWRWWWRRRASRRVAKTRRVHCSAMS